MGRRRIRVKRKGFTAHRRKSTWKVRRGGRTIVMHRRKRSWRVSPAVYLRKDVGKPGKGPKIITLRKGRMTKYAIKLGYLKKDQHIGDLPPTKIEKFAIDLAEEVGPRVAFGMFHALVVLNKRTNPDFAKKMAIGRKAISDRYSHELTPRAAIRKWKSMSPEARARAMPGGRI